MYNNLLFELTDGVSPHAPKYFFLPKKKYSTPIKYRGSCFPKDSLRKDNPELNFNPGAADKWIELFCQIELTKYSSLKNLFQ